MLIHMKKEYYFILTFDNIFYCRDLNEILISSKINLELIKNIYYLYWNTFIIIYTNAKVQITDSWNIAVKLLIGF